MTKISYRWLTFVMLGVFAAVMLTACGASPSATGMEGKEVAKKSVPPTSDAKAKPGQVGKTEQPAKPPKPAKAQPPAKPAPKKEVKPVPQVTHETNLVVNGSFEQKDETGRPRGWAASKASLVKNLESESDAYDGKHTMALKGDAKEWGILAESIKVPPVCLGRALQVSAWGQAPKEWNMFLTVECKEDGKTKELVRKPWPKCADAWYQNVVSAEIPKTADPGSVRIAISVRNEADLQYRVDDVEATLGLLNNPSFEFKDEDGRPRGWAVGPTGLLEKGAESAAFRGRQAVTLKSIAGQWGVLAQPVKLEASDMGKTLTVSAQGQVSKANAMALSIECKVKDETKELKRALWSKAGTQWNQVVVSTPLPKDADPQSVRVVISVRDEAGNAVRVDDVQASLK